MGQRLVVEIYNGDERLANAYYHWSGYTGSSLGITKNIIDEYYNLKDKIFFLDKKKNDIYKAIKLLEVTGSGISEIEMEEFHKIFPGNDKLPECSSRNNGITSFTKTGMDDSFACNEALVTIQLKDESFAFDALYSNSYSEWFDEHSEQAFLNLKDLDCSEEKKDNLKELSLHDIEEWYKEGLITEGTKNIYTIWVSEKDEYISDKELEEIQPMKMEEFLNFSNIKFSEIDKLERIIDKSYENEYTDFYLKDEKDTVYSVIA